MAQYFELPTSARPQSFSLFMGGKLWTITLRWNQASNHWVFDFADGDRVDVLTGVPLVTGVDLVGQHRHLGFGGGLILQTDHDPLQPATFDTLGVTARVFYVVEDA